MTHILLYSGTSSRLASVQYVPGWPGSYQFWPTRTNLATVSLSSGVETATIDLDSTGRMWLASDAVTNIQVRSSDSPYASWSAPLSLDVAESLIAAVWNNSTSAWDLLGWTVGPTRALSVADLSDAPLRYVNASGQIRVRFVDSRDLEREKKDTLSVDLLVGLVASQP